jgi:adenylyl cyclase-associated protein
LKVLRAVQVHQLALEGAGNTLQVNGKVNSILLDSCQKVGIVFHSVVACLEAVNCASIQVQCVATCPTLNIDKTDGAQV